MLTQEPSDLGKTITDMVPVMLIGFVYHTLRCFPWCTHFRLSRTIGNLGGYPLSHQFHVLPNLRQSGRDALRWVALRTYLHLQCGHTWRKVVSIRGFCPHVSNITSLTYTRWNCGKIHTNNESNFPLHMASYIINFVYIRRQQCRVSVILNVLLWITLSIATINPRSWNKIDHKRNRTSPKA